MRSCVPGDELLQSRADAAPKEVPMGEQWKYQLRVYLDDRLAEMARRDDGDAALQPLAAILARHDARMVSQFQAFEDYVAEAEKEGVDGFPLYKWTKATVADPAMRAKHIGTFALRVGGDEVYSSAAADALEAELQPLVGGAIVRRMSKHDTNPANNIPVPPKYRS